MKRIILNSAAALLLIILCPMPSSAEQVETLQLGNCKTGGAGSMQTYSGTGGFALYYPATYMQMFKGCQITEFDIYADASSSITVFVAGEKGDVNAFKQQYTATSKGWNTITLAEPYTLTGDAVYIGYEITGSSYIYRTNRRYDGEEYIRRTGKWETFSNDQYAPAVYAVVSGDDLPKYDVRVTNWSVPEFAKTGTPAPVSFTFVNLGAETVTSLEIEYSIGEKTMTETLDDLNVAYTEEAAVETEGFTIEDEGEWEVVATVTKINGSQDLDMSDNVSDVTIVISRDEFTARKVLFEIFSTENCPNCPQAHELINPIIEDNDNVIEVCHHAAYGYDEFTISASQDYAWLYNTTGTYAPAEMLDRTNMYKYYPSYDGLKTTTPVFDIGQTDILFNILLDVALATPAYATVDISIDYDGSGDAEINVKGERLLPTSGKECRLTVMAVEDGLVTNSQSGASPKAFTYNGSPRVVLSETWGDEIDLDKGYDCTYTLSVSEDWDPANVRIVAFVSVYNENDPNDCYVLNSNEAPLMEVEDIEDGITEAQMQSATLSDGMLLLPDGGGTIEIFDAAGKCLATEVVTSGAYSLSKYPSGLYLLRISTDSGSTTLKFCKTK